MRRCSAWLWGCFTPNLVEKGRFSSLHQMTSAPGLQLRQLRPSSHDTVSVSAKRHWGSALVGGTHWEGCGRERRALCQFALTASLLYQIYSTESHNAAQNKQTQKWGQSVEWLETGKLIRSVMYLIFLHFSSPLSIPIRRPSLLCTKVVMHTGFISISFRLRIGRAAQEQHISGTVTKT